MAHSIHTWVKPLYRNVVLNSHDWCVVWPRTYTGLCGKGLHIISDILRIISRG